ncbi:MAG: hypothetical protein RR931_05685, partial [Mucinivorans sp.]
MFNIKSFINFLGRNKLYTFVTIFGFALALMFVILLSLYTREQFTVDNYHLNGERIVVVAYVVAIPAIWYLCGMWLKDFPYRISISPMVYIISGLVALLVASATIFWQAYQAMMVPPAIT